MKLEKKLNNYIESLENDIGYYKNLIINSTIDEIVNQNNIEMLEQVIEDLEEILEVK